MSAAGEGRPAPRRLGDLGLRLASALVLMAAALWTLHVGGHVFVLFWLCGAAAAFYEWQHMVAGPALRPRVAVGAASLAAAAAFASNAGPDYALEILLAGAVAVGWLAGPARRFWAGLGVLAAGALLVALFTLRFSPTPYAKLAVLWLFALVWGTDVMAYFAGRLIGGRKLWPGVSPSKTWSGFLAGVASGALLGLAVAWQSGHLVVLWQVLGFGLLLACLAQAGDLLESAMKRRFAVKDSSHLIPGHGGFMDRLDGFTAASVCAAMIGVWRVDAYQAAAGLFQ